MLGFKKKDARIKLKEEVIVALKTIFDPEIPVNIYDLGLIYDVSINEEQEVHIKMTLTSPGCPVAQTFPVPLKQESIRWKASTIVKLN